MVAVLLPALICCYVSPPVATRYPLDAYPLARCLDGSPGAYYYRPGSNSSRSFLLFMQGGGWCYPSAAPYTPEDVDSNCLWRSKGLLGTTKKDRSSMTFASGMLSADTNQSIFANYNLVYIRYCDGKQPNVDDSLPEPSQGHS
jgi:hypothetical protein